jgi:hypothetical protein
MTPPRLPTTDPAANDPEFDPGRCTWEEAADSMLGFASDYGMEDPDVIDFGNYSKRTPD